jgi:hypothetical protein
MPVQYRNVKDPPETLSVSYGILGKRIVAADGLILVQDEFAAAYDCQPTVWKRQGVAPVAAGLPAKQPSAPVPQPDASTDLPADDLKPPTKTETEDTSAPNGSPAQTVDGTSREIESALLSKEIADLEAQEAALAAPKTEEVK